MPSLIEKAKIRTTRLRKSFFKLDSEEISTRLSGFYKTDSTDRSIDTDARLQRLAKFRGWTEGRDWIGSETSDASIPDMMTSSLRVQDTLHNAVMTTRPVVTSKALSPANKIKQSKIDSLIDYQIFTEQNGEKMVEELAECFVNDGDFTVFIPWVKEKRKIVDLRVYTPIPPEVLPVVMFREIMQKEFPEDEVTQLQDGWDWQVKEAIDEQVFTVSFYTREGDNAVEMIMEKEVVVFDGPKPIVKDYDDVLFPADAANLQMPGPSNPGGATHVILRDFPTIDEINRLAKSGFYDLISDEDLKRLANLGVDETDKEAKHQKDNFQGKKKQKTQEDDDSHNSLTRILCFDTFDIDGDGIAEDVMWWWIVEGGILLKAAKLGEMYPFNPPRRPIAEATFLPVKGRKSGISLLEMMEGTHDIIKQSWDQTMDWGTLASAPFGFYRPTSSVKQEVMRLWAGELYPLQNPREDVHFPSIQNSSQAFGFNLITMAGQFQEKLTVIGDLQLGRVPAGKASALRTVSGVQTILGQGEARPERILRRFFMGIREMWRQIHELNKEFLPEDKKFRVLGLLQPGDDPYDTISDRSVLKGRFDFDFKANIMNTSKAALQQALNEMIQLAFNPLVIQSGLVEPEGIYRLIVDKVKASGGDPDIYFKAPSPDSLLVPILAEEALAVIMDGQIPSGRPEEGALAHFEKLRQFASGDALGLLEPNEVEIFKVYMRQVAEKAQQELKLQRLQQAAEQAQAGQQASSGQPETGESAESIQQNPPVNPNELLDESLPGAGGGGNAQ